MRGTVRNAGNFKEMTMSTFVSESKPRFTIWTLILAAVLLAGLLSACGPASSAASSEGPTDECGPYEPTEADVKKMLDFGAGAFTSKDWVKNYSVDPYKITLMRRNEVVQAVAYSEYLIYTCGYGQEELADYFSDEGFNIIFTDYESHELTNFCEQKSLALYEYDLVDEGNTFHARYWVKQDTDTRLLVFMLVFPQSNPMALNEYSKQVFPGLVTCP
jgi:hypothetical protein